MKLIGKKVYIKPNVSWYGGEWGTVRLFDGHYHIAICDDPRASFVFDRNEFTVSRSR